MKILFIDGTDGYYPKRLDEKPTGGILTSLTLIPRYLARKGMDVSVMSVYNKNETVRGVKHIAHPSERTDFDVVVFNRNMMNRPLADHFKNSRKIWWLHDIVDHNYLDDDGYTKMDEIVALSQYCKDSFSDYYDIDPARFTIIQNGVDKDVFFPGDQKKRRKNLFVSASAPVKGLYPLEYTLANIKRWDKDAEMRLYSSQGLHEQKDSENHTGLFSRLTAAGATVMAPVPQKELARVFREATALLMPNHYPEICSNVLLQAQACGLPVISTSIGSAAEFIRHKETGMLTKRTPSDLYWWWKDYAKQVGEIYFNEALRAHIAQFAPLDVPSWDEIGEQWTKLLLKGQSLPEGSIFKKLQSV